MRNLVGLDSSASRGLSLHHPAKTLKATLVRAKWSLRNFIKDPVQFLAGGFSLPYPENRATGTNPQRSGVFPKSWFVSQRHHSARRHRPLIVMIHLSTSGRNVLITLFTGAVEAFLLLVLTFFFAAQWGGNLIITLYAMLLLVLFISMGRALGLAYVWISSKVWGLHVINCDEKEEVLGALRIVCSMTGVLVLVNGATFCDGYRLDDIDEFPRWQKRYQDGEFDAEEHPPYDSKGAQKSQSTNSNLGSSSGSQNDIGVPPVLEPIQPDNIPLMEPQHWRGAPGAPGADNASPASQSPSEINRRPVYTRSSTSNVMSAQIVREGDSVV